MFVLEQCVQVGEAEVRERRVKVCFGAVGVGIGAIARTLTVGVGTAFALVFCRWSRPCLCLCLCLDLRRSVGLCALAARLAP